MPDRLKTVIQRWSRQRIPQLDGRLYLQALQGKVTIRRDRWGIPHIHAQNQHDLFLAQGFVHAQDRLWQMELARRAAKGTLSAVFGPITLETDRLSRTFGFARLARTTLNLLEEQAYSDLAAYAAGVNAFLASQPLLPIEFSIVQHHPQPWEMLDSIAYAHLQMWALTHGAIAELVQAQLIQQVNPALVNDLMMTYPENHPATLPEGIEENAQWIDAWQGTAVPWLNPFHGKGNLDGAGRGSNGWVIAPEHSQSGGAILANDMHLPISTPSIWHFQHLRSDDGLHVAGFTQPGIPYIMAGHNGHIAWGATLAYTDSEDLFSEKLHPDNPTLYQFKEEWRPVQQIEEEIAVRFQKTQREIVRLTHHGPLIHQLLSGVTEPLAFSSTSLHSSATIDGFSWLMTAANWDDFVTAVSRIQAPPLNLLYADRQGNIGHWVTGRVPIRAAGDGSLPAPGWTGSHEWIGTIPFEEMPHALNPREGFIISANHRLLPSDKSAHNLGQLWRNGYRAERIHQLMASQSKLSVDDCRRIQRDLLSLPGLQLVTLLDDLQVTHPEAKLALTLLQQWDGYLTSESIGGAVFQALVRQLAPAVLAKNVSPDLLPSLLGEGMSEILHPVNEFRGYLLVTLLKILTKVPSPWFDSLTTRNSMIEHCLVEATAALRQTLGDDPAKWQWGHLHQVTFKHPLGQITPFDRVFNVGPFPLGGDANTVAQAGMRPGSYANDGISVSSRFIIDFSAVEQAEAVLAPGQSGYLGSPHYNDLAQMWLHGENFPVLWAENAVNAATQHKLTLTKGP